MTRDALTPERWTQVQELLLEALALPRVEREAFVARTCAGDEGLAAEIRSLLAASDDEGLLPHTLEARTPAPPPALQWVGPYRLQRELGRGGMGTVYLAQREGEGFTQRVALKLIRPDYVDPRVVAALGAERRILARLEHPGIARFIDGGTTASGQPYVAMEYVDGTPLLQFADSSALDVRARVRLLLDVGAAVQHAHRQLVVHRDLKPGNILVTADGTTKLLDFGIATVLDDPGRVPGRETALWITPAYSSPEQLLRGPVSTLTDVYALGVILYELLAGTSPYDFGDGSLPAIMDAVCRRIPDPPSSAARGAGHPERARTIAGDLDAVVLRALAKEPSERYGSVAQLCEDLQRWLDHEPVRAVPEGVAGRLRRFARRHRSLVVAGGITLLTLLAGLAATLWQARRAGLERDRARAALARSEEVSRFLLNLVESADPRRMAGDTTVGRAILRMGLDRVEELRDQPLVQADMLDALGRVLASLGQHEHAGELHLRSIDLRRRTPGSAPVDVAPSLVALGRTLFRRARYDEAEARYREALALLDAEARADDPRLGEALMELAFLLPYRAREAESESLYAVASQVFARTVGPADRRTLEARQKLVARVKRRDVATGETMLRALIGDADRALGAGDPFTAMCKFHLGDYILQQRPDYAEAERWYREGIAEIERRLGVGHLELVHGLNSLSRARLQQGDVVEAEALARRSLAITEGLLGPQHESTAGSVALLAWLYERMGRMDDAEAARRDMLARYEAALGPHHPVVAQGRSNFAALLYRRGKLDEAEREWRVAIDDLTRGFGPEHAERLRARMRLAALLEATGRPEEARRLCAEGVAGIRRAYAPDHAVQREARAESPHCDWEAGEP